MGPTLDLTRLVDELRAAGFKVDTRQYLTAHQLLLVLAAKEGRLLEGEPEALRTHLGPIFCTSREEQERFGDVLRGHLGERRPAPAPPEEREQAPEPGRLNYWKWLGAAAALIFLALGAAALHRHYAPVEIRVQVKTEPESQQQPTLELRPGGKVELNADGTCRLRLAPVDGVRQLHAELKGYDPVAVQVGAAVEQPVVLTLRQSQVPAPTPKLKIGLPRTIEEVVSAPRVLRTNWLQAMEWAIVVAFLTYLALELAARLRRRLALFQYPIDHRPDFATLAVTDLSVPQLAGSSLRRVAAALRRRRATGELEFDVSASVEGAARSGGLLQPVFAPRRVLPEYLVLIQRCDPEDHQAHLFEALLDGLQHHGVVIERYFFEEDPRVCFSREDPTRPRRLAELVSRHHRANLLLLTDADTCFNPHTGKPARWLRGLRTLPRRALFTLAPPAQWTQLEGKLEAEGVDVVPATEEGLTAYVGSETSWRLARLFPAPYVRPFPESLCTGGTRWLERYAPPEEELVLLERELQDYLGPEGFAWLAACAVYPGIGIPITLDVGQALKEVAGGREQESGMTDTLAALARLPWFRHGIMPEWLRRLLLARLTHEQETVVRRRMFERLDVLAQRTLAARKEGVERAGLRISGWVGPLDLLSTAPPESPMGDAVFLAYMAGARFESPVLEAPGRLRRLFHRLGWARLREAALLRQPPSWVKRVRARIRALALHRPFLLRSAAALAVGLVALGLLAPTLTAETRSVERDGALTAFAFSQDGSRMVIGRSDGDADVLDVASGKKLRTLTGVPAQLVSVAASNEAEQVITADANRMFQLWNGKTGELLRKWAPDELGAPKSPSSSKPNVVELSPDQRRLAILWQDGSTQVLTLEKGGMVPYSTDLDEAWKITAFGFEADGVLATVFENGAVWRWRGEDTNAEKASLDLSSSTNTPALTHSRLLPMSKAGSLVIDESNPLRVWDAHSGRLIRRLNWDAEVVVSATVSRNSKWVAAASSKGAIRLWSLADGSQIGDLSQPGVVALHFDPGGGALAAVTKEAVQLWPLEEPVPEPERKPVVNPVPDGPAAYPTPTMVRVPHVTDMKLAEARRELQKVGLRPQPVQREPSSAGAPGEAEDGDIVVAQALEPGTRIAKGSKVRLTVRPAEPAAVRVTTVPDVHGLVVKEAVVALERAGLKAALRGETNARSGSLFSNTYEMQVVDQIPSAGTVISVGASVDIVAKPKPPPLFVSSVNPQEIGPGKSTLFLEGLSLDGRIEVSIAGGVETLEVHAKSPALLVVTVNVDSKAPSGGRSLTVRNSSGGEFTLPDALMVRNPERPEGKGSADQSKPRRPVVKFVRPQNIHPGSLELLIEGENLDDVVLVSIPHGVETLKYIPTSKPNSLSVFIKVDPQAPLGPRPLILYNSSGEEFTFPNVLSVVKALPAPATK